MPRETREERKILRRKRQRDALLYYAKVSLFIIMIIMLFWCVYAFFSQSKLIKDRRDTGQLIINSWNK
jgi:hypothetical protein